jgi:hypothetical protein
MAIDFSKYGTPIKQTTTPQLPTKTDFNKYGKVVSPSTQDVEEKSILGKAGEIASEVFKGATKPVVELAARPVQLAGALAGKRPEETDINLPYYGEIKTPRTGSDVVKDVGRGVEAVTLGMGGGTVLKTGKEALKQTTKELIKQGAKQGAKEGALFGVGSALERKGTDVTPMDIAKESAIGGVSGGIIGGAVPAVIGGVKKGFGMIQGQTSPVKTETQKLLEKGIPDTRIATSKIEGGKIVPDKTATEAIKQGLPEADVALIKTASATDKSKMSKMLDIREKGLTNKRIIERSTDVAGDTFLSQAKHIEKVNKQAIKQLNVVAQRLEGKSADATEALVKFAQDMETSGIGVRKNGTLNFKGSDFEGLGSVQNTINTIWNRARRVAKSGDALQLHRMKSYIDEVVNYGKATEGLGGKAERILKGLRHNIDATLDSKFPAYNKVNSVLTDTISQLGEINASMGRKFKIGDTFSGMHAGTTLRRIISNTQSRSNLLRLLQTMQVTAKKYGLKSDDDIINQVLFSDTLEKMFGSEAPTSFLGQIERGVKGAEEAAGIMSDLWQGRPLKAGLKTAKTMIDYTRGINEKNKINALKELLTTGTEKVKPTTVFGKSPKGKGGTQPPKQVFGAVAGIEQDEEGNIRFNPAKAGIGMLGVAGFTKAAESGAFKNIKSKVDDAISDMKKAKVSGQSFDDWVKGQKDDLIQIYRGQKNDTFTLEGPKDGIGRPFSKEKKIADVYGRNGKVLEGFVNKKDVLQYESLDSETKKYVKTILDDKLDNVVKEWQDYDNFQPYEDLVFELGEIARIKNKKAIDIESFGIPSEREVRVLTEDAFKTTSQLKAMWDTVADKSDDIITSIKAAKAGGETFDDWVSKKIGETKRGEGEMVKITDKVTGKSKDVIVISKRDDGSLLTTGADVYFPRKTTTDKFNIEPLNKKGKLPDGGYTIKDLDRIDELRAEWDKVVKEPEVFKGFDDLSTKTLEKLKGRSTVSKQFISDLTNSPDLKQSERNVIKQILDTESDKISVPEFAKKVKNELLPLKNSSILNKEQRELLRNLEESRSDIFEKWKERGIDVTVARQKYPDEVSKLSDINDKISKIDSGYFGGESKRYESVTLPKEIRGNVADYNEHVYESPIETSAGQVHFPQSKKYYGHTRVEDMQLYSSKSGQPLVGDFETLKKQGFDPVSTRRVIEVQSDLYQKGRLENEKSIINRKGADISRNMTFDEKTGLYTTKSGKKMTAEEARAYRSKYVRGELNKLSKLEQYNDPTAHFRMVREEVKKAAQDGKTKLQFPTGETAMKIEGLGDIKRWWLSNEKSGLDASRYLDINDLKVGQMITEAPSAGVSGYDDWVITDVLGDGKFKAVPKSELDKIVKDNPTLAISKLKNMRTIGGELENWLDRMSEQFDISGKIDTENPIYKFYEKDLGRYLRSKYNAKLITDKQGVNWFEVDVKPDYAKMPVEAFGIAPLGLLGKSNFGKRNEN